ncbi:MAG TPA: hypothetical protein VHO71_01500 [Caproiciproducens sp.]|nr:hypothetical protein [Caproiciproducens sp.]
MCFLKCNDSLAAKKIWVRPFFIGAGLNYVRCLLYKTVNKAFPDAPFLTEKGGKFHKKSLQTRDNKNNNSHKGHMSHMWMMVLCCGVPLLLIALVSLFGASFPVVRVALIPVLPFLCPILMAVMIPMMFMGHNRNCDREEKIPVESEEDKLKGSK